MATRDLRWADDPIVDRPGSWDRKGHILLLCLTLLAFVPRLLAFVFFIDSPGDGPARVMIAYRWAQAPYLDLSSGWPPGYAYLAGAVSFVIRDPAIAGRVLNVVLGTFTVPVWYLLVRRIFSGGVALFSAVILAFVPLHVGLSASSMTEASYIFELVAGLLCFILATDSAAVGRAGYLSAATVLVLLATLTRYEAWVLVPVLPAYYYAKTKDRRVSLILLALLLVFPVSWIIGNLFASGSNGFLVAFRGSPLPSGGRAVDPLEATRIFLRSSMLHLGWILPAAAAVGVAMQLRHAWRRDLNPERVLYLILCCMVCGFDFLLTASHGWYTYWAGSRWYLDSFAWILPFAALPIGRYLEDVRLRAALTILALASLVPVGVQIYRASARPDTTVHVTRARPTAIRSIGTWLESPPQRDAAVMATQLEWQSTYLPLFFPEIQARYFIVSVWTSDDEIKGFLRTRRPTLLITQDGTEDAKARSRIKRLGATIRQDRLMRRESQFRVYALDPERASPQNMSRGVDR